jgi:DNA-binding ferritin-like protein
MDKRLNTITTSAQNSDEFQQAFAQIQAAAIKRMPETPLPAATPSLRRMTSGTSAFTPMLKLKPTKTLDLPVTLQDALRHAGISFAHDGIESLQDSLTQAQLERHKKLQEHYESTTTSTHDRFAERSSKADTDMKAIMDALYKHTPFQQVSLTNPRLEEQIERMERELEKKDRELLDAEGSELSLSDPRVRAFVAKYGR